MQHNCVAAGAALRSGQQHPSIPSSAASRCMDFLTCMYSKGNMLHVYTALSHAAVAAVAVTLGGDAAACRPKSWRLLPATSSPLDR
jgi:hypothetical protein